jgi:hypothetical protein
VQLGIGKSEKETRILRTDEGLICVFEKDVIVV